MHSMDYEVTQVGWVPQGEFRSSAIFNIFTHLVRRAQSGNEDLADQVRVCNGSSRGCDTHCGGRNDDFEIWILGEESLCFAVALGVIVVAVDHLNKFQVGVLRFLKFLLHHFDPSVLVWGSGGGTQYGDLPTIFTREFRRHLDLDRADTCGLRLVDEQITALGRYCRIPSDYWNPRVHGGLARWNESIGIIG